jgi:hypothetical protein
MVDFDFFSESRLKAIKWLFSFMGGGQAETPQDQGNTWVVLVPSVNPEEKGVKVSFLTPLHSDELENRTSLMMVFCRLPPLLT